MKNDKTLLVPKRKFRGYTIEDIKYRQLVNDLKIKIEQDKLMLEIMPPEPPLGVSSTTVSQRIDMIITYGQMAFMAFKIVRRVRSFFQKFRQ